jgi:hypothetical protein
MRRFGLVLNSRHDIARRQEAVKFDAIPPRIEVMVDASRPESSFIDSLLKAIRNRRNLSSGYSVILLATAPHLRRSERRKLLGWGELVLRTTAPDGAIVEASEDLEACVVVLPASSGDALERADAYGEQLNRLPVAQVAPGFGWAWDARRFEANAAAEAVKDFLSAF